MNQVKSSNDKKNVGIVSAMRPLWRVGIPASAALSAALAVAFAVAVDGCSSSKSNKTETASTSHSSVPSSGQGTNIAALPDLSKEPITTAKKSRPVVQRLSTVGYVDDKNGVSFRYPRNYALLTPEKTKLDQSMEQVPMNFVQPGGVSLATIGWANGPTTSLFNVSVNKSLTAQQCEQFAVPDASDVAGNSPVDASDSSVPTKVSLHGEDFTRVESGTEQNDIRYYHRFENGACYEFTMAVEEAQGNTKPVDHFELFDKLERIMATVKIKPETVPAMTATVPSGSTSGSIPR
jgi:hypothetical protein